MYEMLREMKQWRESQDRLSLTLMAKLTDSAGRDAAATRDNSEETTPRRAERSTEASPERRNIELSADKRVREESTLARKSPPSRRKGKDSPSVSVSGETTRQPGGGEENPPPKRKSKGRAVTYAPETFRRKNRAEYSGVDTTPWSEEEQAFVEERPKKKKKKKRARRREVDSTDSGSGSSDSSDFDSDLESDSGRKKSDRNRRRKARLPKITNKAWPMFDPEKARWDEWKAKTVRKWQRLGYDDDDIVVHLVDAIPGEAVLCLEKRGLADAGLAETMSHLDRLYGSKISTNPVMAEAQLDKTVRGPREQAHRFCRRVEVLATAAALPGEDIDMKAMRSFVKGYNCSITEPKLWGALERSDCTLTRLVSIAEKCEVRYKLKRDDPVADRQPKMHMSPDNDRPQKTRAIFPEDRSANGDGSWTKSALCHKCGMTGHIRLTCE